MSGMAADARTLIEHARVQAQVRKKKKEKTNLFLFLKKLFLFF
jgi:20S proteasome alpha/beta subunit